MNERRPDFELLHDFARDRDQAAFTAVVRRHLDLVYGTALRKLEDQGAAEEVVQDVFAALAQSAWKFGAADSVPAWLHKTTLLKAKGWWRGELRRRRREQTAAELGTTMNASDEQRASGALLPLLDEALLSLREKDRAALLLRFYEKQPLRELGTALGVSEDAAQKRVAAALESLSHYFQRRGFKTATVAVAIVALQRTAVAPGTVANKVLHAATRISPPTFAGMGVFMKLAALSNVQKAVLGALLLLAVPLGWYWKQNARPQIPQTQAAVQPVDPQPDAEPPAVQTRGAVMAVSLVQTTTVAPAGDAKPKRYNVRVTGIIDLPDFKAALLELNYTVANPVPARPDVVGRNGREQSIRTNALAYTNYFLLKEGQAVDAQLRPEGLKIMVVRIDSENWTVKALEGKEEAFYAFDAIDRPVSGGNLRLQNAQFLEVMKVFGQLAGRTVLVHPAIKASPISCTASVGRRPEAADALKAALRENHISVSPDGDKFERVVPHDLEGSLPKLPAPPPAAGDAPILPAGVIHFENIPLPQMLAIYAELVGRKMAPAQSLPPASIFLITENPLTRDEVIYAFETLLAWQGLKIEVQGDTFRVVHKGGH